MRISSFRKSLACMAMTAAIGFAAFFSPAMASGPPVFDLCLSETVTVQDQMYFGQGDGLFAAQCDAVELRSQSITENVLISLSVPPDISLGSPVTCQNLTVANLSFDGPAFAHIDPGPCFS